jgi:hypothetical protein
MQQFWSDISNRNLCFTLKQLVIGEIGGFDPQISWVSLNSQISKHQNWYLLIQIGKSWKIAIIQLIAQPWIILLRSLFTPGTVTASFVGWFGLVNDSYVFQSNVCQIGALNEILNGYQSKF